MPMGFIVTTSNEGYNIARILRGVESIKLEYIVSRRPHFSSFNVSATNLGRLALKASHRYEEEAIEAFKVGFWSLSLSAWIGKLFGGELETEDDSGELVHVDEPIGQSLDACKG